MRIVSVIVALVLAAPALASQEEIHVWRSATIAATTRLFGDVRMKATASADGNVKTLVIESKGKSITVPAKWIATLPPMPLASLEIRTERGWDKDPWLYAYFRRGPLNTKGTVEMHLAVQAGKLIDASIVTLDGTGGGNHETRKP